MDIDQRLSRRRFLITSLGGTAVAAVTLYAAPTLKVVNAAPAWSQATPCPSDGGSSGSSDPDSQDAESSSSGEGSVSNDGESSCDSNSDGNDSNNDDSNNDEGDSG